MIVEVSGPPGIGKTAALLSLAVDARRTTIDRTGDDKGEVLIVGECRARSSCRLEADGRVWQTPRAPSPPTEFGRQPLLCPILLKVAGSFVCPE